MKIGIDISQIVFEGTGVSEYVRHMVTSLVRVDTKNEYVLFGSSLRQSREFGRFMNSLGAHASRVRLVTVKLPPVLLDLLWNRMHIIPIEWFIGPIDVFWSSDWTQPPLSHAKGVTTIHDLSHMRFSKESHDIVEWDVRNAQLSADIAGTQQRRLIQAMRECQVFLCDSEATKKDAEALLGIHNDKLIVIYPGYP